MDGRLLFQCTRARPWAGPLAVNPPRHKIVGRTAHSPSIKPKGLAETVCVKTQCLYVTATRCSEDKLDSTQFVDATLSFVTDCGRTRPLPLTPLPRCGLFGLWRGRSRTVLASLPRQPLLFARLSQNHLVVGEHHVAAHQLRRIHRLKLRDGR